MSQRICWLSMSEKRSLSITAYQAIIFLAAMSVFLWPAFALAQQPSTPPEGSLEHYRALAEKGNAEAQVKLADLYRIGKDLPQNFSEAAKWYRSAAEQGAAEAQFRLGELYFDGKGVAQDVKEAANWLEKAAAQGHQAAKAKLSEMKTKTQDSLKDLNKALDLIR
jgi:TPR repeat protein